MQNNWRAQKKPTLATHIWRVGLSITHLITVMLYIWFVAYRAFIWDLRWPPTSTNFQTPLLVVFSIVYWLRLQLMMYLLIPRQIAMEEFFSVGCIFVPLIHFSFAYCHQEYINNTLNAFSTSPTGAVITGFLFLVGSLFNSVSEWQRMVFKRNPDNKGKLFTGGLYKLSRHPNYFGDVVLFSGWALLTGSPWNLWAPTVMFLAFTFYHIPDMELYMANRYKEWSHYAKDTKALIPFVM